MDDKNLLDTNIIKIKGRLYDMDERVGAKTACLILDCSYSFLTKETSKRTGRKLPFYKKGNSRTSRLEFSVRDLLNFQQKDLLYYDIKEGNS